MTSVPKEKITDKDCASYIQELYVIPEFRRRGIAKDIFLSFIESQQQDIGFCMVEDSLSGVYWKKLLEEAGYKYDIYQEDDVKVFCHIHMISKAPADVRC